MIVHSNSSFIVQFNTALGRDTLKMSTCLGFIPLRIGVISIAMFQITYGTTRIYLASRVEGEDRGFNYYLDFTSHCMGLAAAGFLALGLL